MRRARLRKRRIQVECGEELDPILGAMPGAVRMDGSWWVRLRLPYVHWLRSHHFDFNRKLQKWYRENGTLAKVDVTMPMPLRAYQQTGISFIESREGRALVGDDMGLGKTPTALGWLTLHPEIRPAIVICPASIKWNWLAEIQTWMPGTDAIMVEGRCPDTFPMDKDIYVVNYDVLANARVNKGIKKRRMYELPGTGWADRLLELKPKALIIDEGHKLKNPAARWTVATLRMAAAISNAIILTGTPMENYPAELYPLFKILRPWMAPNEMDFYWRYSEPKRWGTRWDFTGSDNLDELNDTLNAVMIRRLKTEVLTELPPKQRHIVRMPITNAAVYRKAETNLIKYLKETVGEKKATKAAGAEALVRFEVLKQLAWEGMKKFAIDWLRDFIAGGHKIVVFTTHKGTVADLQKAFPNNSVTLDGDTAPGDRKEVVQRFQNDPGVALFFGNMKAASVGLNLIAASDTCFVELGWTPTLHEQCEDRVNRYGQLADSIAAWYLIPVGTIYEVIFELLNQKSKRIDQVVDGKRVSKPVSILGALINELERRK